MSSKQKYQVSELPIIKESEEMLQGSGRKSKYAHYANLSALTERPSSASNIVDFQLWNQPTEKIVNQCHDNPFLLSKLRYLLRTEDNLQTQEHIHPCGKGKASEEEWQKTTLKNEVNRLKEVRDRKLR